MADVFLSYAKEDRPRARNIADILQSCGWSVFWDHMITPGDEWRGVIQAELDRATVVVVLWSHSSVSSTWVQEEAERGRARLVSVLMDEVELPIGFSAVQGVDLIGWQGGRADGIGKLVDAVANRSRVPRKRPPKIPKSHSQKRAVAAAVGLVVAGAASYPITRWLRTPPPIMNQEIVLDTSIGMGTPFDNKPSKLVAAVEALRDRTLHPTENLALRTFGGDCGQNDESRLLVPFGTKRGGRIVNAASRLEPRGQPTLVSGVISALTDIHPLPHTRRVVVITGHVDACDAEAVRELKLRFEAQPKSEMAKEAVVLEMRFIGLALSAEDEPRLRQMSDAVGGDVYFVSTAAELNKVLQYVIEFEPAVLHVRNVWKVVDEVVGALNNVAANTNNRRFDEATSIVDAGEAAYAELQPSFESLAAVRLSVNFERFYKLAAQNRSLQAQAFAAGRGLISTGRELAGKEPAGDEQHMSKWNEAVAKWNEIIARYNTNAQEMNRLTAEIVKETRRAG